MSIRHTNRGTPIDMDLFLTANKNVRAVGNMRVNAAGDVLGPGGEIIQKNEDRVRAYYKDNPKSSTSQASLKGKLPGAADDVELPASAQPKTTETLKENKRTAKPRRDSAPVATPDTAPPEPEEFDAPQEPLGHKEVEMPNGDIELVPVYKKEDL